MRNIQPRIIVTGLIELYPLEELPRIIYNISWVSLVWNLMNFSPKTFVAGLIIR